MNSHDSHVFVVQGDLSKVACHAWLVTGEHKKVGSAWTSAVGDAEPKLWVGRTGILEPSPGEPLRIVTDLGGVKNVTPVEWYIEGAAEFVQRAADELKRLPEAGASGTALGRERSLIAMSLVGTSRGNANPGEVARNLLPRLRELAHKNNLDIAVVERDPKKVSAIQFVRRQSHEEHWPALDGDQQKLAKDLGKIAREGKLVLFLGAGVSQAAGLPDWRGLLEKLWETKAELRRATSYKDIPPGMDLLDIAEIAEQVLGKGGLGEAIKGILTGPPAKRYSLAHGLLANLPVAEAVTTNYDELFETAIKGACKHACAPKDTGRCKCVAGCERLARLPWDNPQGRDRWLLKLHGCASKPKSIVLTRHDFLGYRKEREALAGIVQAMLMTKHLLFVGFSLNDPNFHQIVHDVRRATHGRTSSSNGGSANPHSQMGTNLSLFNEPLSKSLWKKDLNWAPMLSELESDKKKKVAARHLEVFLDRVAFEATDTSRHLLDSTLEESLDDDDREMKKEFEEFLAKIARENLSKTQAATHVVSLAEQMGYRSNSK